MRFPPQFLDEIRTRTMLSALVGKSVKLTRAGREWKACCPFHHEKSPSFYVNDDKGFYHCFGCSAHGDAIRWMTDQRGLGFLDAVKELAEAQGIALPEPDLHAIARDDQNAKSRDVIAAAAEWFAKQLEGNAGPEARAYLTKRRIAAESVASFGLGFAPDSRDALRKALADFGDHALIEAGLLILVEERQPYDRFRGRLMIPIRDARGRVIAFGGRIMGAGEPKYLNSPDTPLFDKGRTLYNLDKATPAARKAGRLIVVEGYMDVIALAQVGIIEAVAPLGTALTEAQMERLWRIVDVPILCFDGDKAGLKAAVRAAERALPLLGPGRTLDFALLTDGRDPDDLVREGGRPAIEAVFGATTPLSLLLWDHEFAALPLDRPEARAGLKRRLDEQMETIRDANVRRHYQAEMRQRIDAAFFARPQATGRQQGRGRGRFQPPPAPLGDNTRRISGGGIDPVYARAVIAGLLRHTSMIRVCAEALSTLPIEDDGLDRMRRLLIEHGYSSHDIETEAFDAIFADAGLASLAVDLRRANGLAFSFTRRDAQPDVARRDLAMAIEALAARPELDAALDAATARLAMGSDADGFAEQVRLHEARAEAERVLTALAHGEDD